MGPGLNNLGNTCYLNSVLQVRFWWGGGALVLGGRSIDGSIIDHRKPKQTQQQHQTPTPNPINKHRCWSTPRSCTRPCSAPATRRSARAAGRASTACCASWCVCVTLGWGCVLNTNPCLEGAEGQFIYRSHTHPTTTTTITNQPTHPGILHQGHPPGQGRPAPTGALRGVWVRLGLLRFAGRLRVPHLPVRPPAEALPLPHAGPAGG